MGFGRKSRSRDKRSKSPEIHLLTGFFGLDRKTLEAEERHRARRATVSDATDDSKVPPPQKRKVAPPVQKKQVSSSSSSSESSDDDSSSTSSDSSSSSSDEESSDSDSEEDDSDDSSEESDDSDDEDDESSHHRCRKAHRAAAKAPVRSRQVTVDVKKKPEKSSKSRKEVVCTKLTKPARSHTSDKSKAGKIRSQEPASKQKTVKASSKASKAAHASKSEGSKVKRSSNMTPTPKSKPVSKPPMTQGIRGPSVHPGSVNHHMPQQFPPHGYYHPSFYPPPATAHQLGVYPAPVFTPQPGMPYQRHQPQFANISPSVSQSGLHQRKPTGPMVFAQGVANIQAQIDGVSAQLARQPGNVELKAKIDALQQQLNKALNIATASRNEPSAASNSFASSSKVAQHENSNIAPREVADASQHSRPADRDSMTKEEPIPAARKQTNSSERESHVHRCYGCGNTRSLWYHEKYPVEANQSARNLCENCLDGLIDGGAVGERHYCCGCGRARSKNFHRKHPATRGNPLLLNFCAHCEAEMRSTDSATMRASVYDSVSYIVNKMNLHSLCLTVI